MLLSLSSRGDYGFLIMTMLAESDADIFISISEIAKVKQVPSAYASQLVMSLKKARLIESKEGTSGGYRLARPASEITLKEIVEALEGPIAPVKCLRDKDHVCPSESNCTIKPFWAETTLLVEQQLANKKLSDLVKK